MLHVKIRLLSQGAVWDLSISLSTLLLGIIVVFFLLLPGFP